MSVALCGALPVIATILATLLLHYGNEQHSIEGDL